MPCFVPRIYWKVEYHRKAEVFFHKYGTKVSKSKFSESYMVKTIIQLAFIWCESTVNNSRSAQRDLLGSYHLLLLHCCVILPYKGKRTRKVCQCITLYNPGLTKCSGIINLLFGFLVDNISENILLIAPIF